MWLAGAHFKPRGRRGQRFRNAGRGDGDEKLEAGGEAYACPGAAHGAGGFLL